MAAALRLTSGPSARLLAAWIACASKFLAGAGLAQEQHGTFAFGRTARLLLGLQCSPAGADELAEAVLGLAPFGQLPARAGQVGLHLLELGNDRLQRLQAIVEDHAQAADHVAGLACSGMRETTIWRPPMAKHVEQVGLAGFHDMAQAAVGHDLLDGTAFDRFGAVPADQRLVLVVDPGDAAGLVHHHGAFVEAVEEA
jgi:hypothetical protein